MGERRPSRSEYRQRPSKATFWVRRIVALLVLALIVAGVVFGVRCVLSWRQAAEDSKKVAAEKSTQDSVLVEPTECSADNLSLSVAPKQDSYEVGSTVEFSINLENTDSENPCTINGSLAEVGLEITTGEVSVWQSTTCNQEADEQLLLLGTGMEYSSSIAWDGHLYQDCEVGDFAQAGTYHVTPVLQGQKLEGDAVFVLQ